MAKIGFLGLGIMGRGMAMNLLKAGHAVTVYNRTRSKAEELVPLGATVAETPKQAASDNEVVFTMLADPPAVEQVAFGPDGLMEGLERGSVLIDCTTVDPAASLKLAEAAGGKGAKFLDSPVGGSKAAAEQGELILMLGGDADTLEQVRPILEAVSKKIIHAGKTPMGTYLKLTFNLVGSHMMVALSEALILGAKAGLDPAVMLDTINSSALASPLYDWKGNKILDRDYSTQFSIRLMHKDLNLIMSAAYGLDLPLPTTAAVKELFGTAKSCCDPEQDLCFVIRALEAATGVEVKRR